jgi:hypothetical protein
MSHKTILLKGDPLIKEAKASGAIYPGQLMEYYGSDEIVRVHSTGGGRCAGLIALENSLEGDEVGTVYASGARVRYAHLRPGDEFLAYIDNHETAAIGTFLESNGNGYFRVAEPDSSVGVTVTGSVKAMALQAVSGTGSSRSLIKAVAV